MTLLTPDGRIDTSFGDLGIVDLGTTTTFLDLQGDFGSTRVTLGEEQMYSLSGGRILYLRSVSYDFPDFYSGDPTQIRTFGGRVINPDGSADASFTFDGAGALPAAFVGGTGSLAGELETRNGRLLPASRQLADGSVQMLFARDGTEAPDETEMFATATVAPDGTVSQVVNLHDVQTDAGSVIRDSSTGDILLIHAPVEPGQETFLRFGGDGTPTGEVTLSSAVAETTSIITSTIANDGQVLAAFYEQAEDETYFIGKVQMSDAPTGVVHARPIRAARPGSYRFTVSWHDDDDMDVASLASRHLIVDLPDGSARTAVFESSAPSSDAALVTASYHFIAPGGNGWDAQDNGKYQVRVRGRYVSDSTSHRTPARILGQFFVNISDSVNTSARQPLIHQRLSREYQNRAETYAVAMLASIKATI
jgi:hypothetical protein